MGIISRTINWNLSGGENYSNALFGNDIIGSIINGVERNPGRIYAQQIRLEPFETGFPLFPTIVLPTLNLPWRNNNQTAAPTTSTPTSLPDNHNPEYGDVEVAH